LWCSLTWNLLGMLSNTFFRIKMQPKANQEGQLCLYCEHPTKSGGEPGGWMEREAMANGGMAAVTEKQAVASTNVDTSKLKTFTLEEVCQPYILNILFTLNFWHSLEHLAQQWYLAGAHAECMCSLVPTVCPDQHPCKSNNPV